MNKIDVASKVNPTNLYILSDDNLVGLVSYLEVKEQVSLSKSTKKLHSIVLNFFFCPEFFGARSEEMQKAYDFYSRCLQSQEETKVKQEKLNSSLETYHQVMKRNISYQYIVDLFGGGKKFEELPVLKLNEQKTDDYFKFINAKMLTSSVMRGVLDEREFISILHRKIIRRPDKIEEEQDVVMTIQERYKGCDKWVIAGDMPRSGFHVTIIEKGEICDDSDYKNLRTFISGVLKSNKK